MVKRTIRWLLLILLIYFSKYCKNRRTITYSLIRESTMGLIYRAFLPPVKAVDVVTRLIKYRVNEQDSILEVSVLYSYFDLPPVKEGDECQLSIKDVDDAGNESDWSISVAFTAKDTIVPGTPEGLSVKLNREVADEVPAPVPTPQPEVTPVVEDTSAVETVADETVDTPPEV